jgi:hypothetical protein
MELPLFYFRRNGRTDYLATVSEGSTSVGPFTNPIDSVSLPKGFSYRLTVNFCQIRLYKSCDLRIGQLSQIEFGIPLHGEARLPI